MALQDALRNWESFSRTIMDHLPIGIAVNSVEPTVEFIYMNDNFPKIYRTTREALSDPDTFWDVVYEDPVFRRKIKNRVEADCASGDPDRMYWEDIPFTRKGEGPFYICARNVPLKDGILMLSTVWDVTGRKRAEEELAKEATRRRNLMDQSRDGIVIIDQAGQLIESNRRFADMLGYPFESMHRLKVFDWEFQFPPDRLIEMITSVDEKGDHFETRHRRRDGSIYDVEISTNAAWFDGQKLIFCICRDITERKRAEAENEKLQAQLIQTQKLESVGRLAGGVAHDFNNMLGVILGHVEFALEQAEKDESLHDGLKEIQKAAQRSADLTRQLLTFARKDIISPRQLDLNDIVESMLSMLRRIIGEEIDLVWKPAAHIWPVKMDPSQIDQILANLCINARDAIPGAGRLTIETGNNSFDAAYCTEHPGVIPGDFVLLAVNDNGCGMDKDTLENLFEPFFTTKDIGKGTGLGLAAIYGIVKQNKGFINVDSEPGQGSAFRIYLPRFFIDLETVK